MTPKGIRIAREFIPKAKFALRTNGYPTQQALADDAQLALCTVSKFLNGKRILFANFVELSTLLDLNWQEISALDLPHSENVDRKTGLIASESQDFSSSHGLKRYSSPQLFSIAASTLKISIVVLYSSENTTDRDCA